MERYNANDGIDAYIASPECHVETNTGLHFRMDKPVFEIETIAHSLSLMCRYNGHCRSFYSVAEHSVIVALLMDQLKLGDPKEGLLHDAVEAYMTDVTSPWKPLIPDWRRLDKNLDAHMRKQFNLPEKMTDGAKEADWLALFIEAWYLMPSRGEGWGDPTGARSRALRLVDEGWRPACLYPPEARKAFDKMWSRVQ